jgi:hypothetical protein
MLVSACFGESETSLAEQRTLPRPEVTCSGISSNASGLQLVDPPGTCSELHSGCSNGQIYEVACDGLECECRVDGQPTGKAPLGRCPDVYEAAELCDWSVSPAFSGRSLVQQGLPCREAGPTSADCYCLDDRWMCPGAQGCNMVGAYRPVAREVPVVTFLADGTFAVAERTASASLSQIVQEQASGFYGTWTLQGDVLSLRSKYASGRERACSDTPGRYTPTFDAACHLRELARVDDECQARLFLATSFEPAE